MTDQSDIHYATLIRLQVAMSALQDLLAEDEDMVLDMLPIASAALSSDPDFRQERIDRWRAARANAGAAIQIALGAQSEVPDRLMANWGDLAMKRAVTRGILQETAR